MNARPSFPTVRRRLKTDPIATPPGFYGCRKKQIASIVADDSVRTGGRPSMVSMAQIMIRHRREHHRAMWPARFPRRSAREDGVHHRAPLRAMREDRMTGSGRVQSARLQGCGKMTLRRAVA
jgi:hypothetical protein